MLNFVNESASDGRDERFMRLALIQAEHAALMGEVPVGAVLVAEDGDTVLAACHNQPISACDPTAHAEMMVIRAAAQQLGNYRLAGCTLYVTLEPCTMCVGALVHARVGRVVFAASEPKAGALQSQRRLMDADAGYFNHRFLWRGGVMAEASASLLQAFFRARRHASAPTDTGIND